MHLDGQFPGRSQHETTGHVASGVPIACDEALDHWQAECGGPTRAGLCAR
jgi:hypothetical protein